MKLRGWLALAGIAFSPAAQAGDRDLYAISDLHFGVGRTGGAWDAYEDFRWTREWKAFLDHLAARSPAGAELILNGDSFELWQSTTSDCKLDDANKDLGCSEEEARARLERTLAAHAEDIAALRAFAERENNRVVIVPGNHDAALLFETSRKELEKVAGPKVVVAASGYFLSSDRRVLLEHGQQFDDLNKLEPWPKPFKTHNGTRYLVRPWGESFVQEIFNGQEREYPIIDNINDNAVGVDYYVQAEARKAGNDPNSFWARSRVKAKSFGMFLKFALLRTSWSQFGDSLGGTKEPTWDVAAIRTADDSSLLIAMLPPDSGYVDVAQVASQTPEGLGLSWKELGEDQIRDLCTAQAKRARDTQQELRLCPTTNEGLGGEDPASLGAASTKLFSTDDIVLAKYLKSRGAELAAVTPGWNGEFAIYVFSHTHTVRKPYRVIDEGPWRPTVVNTGAWQRVASKAYVAKLRAPNEADFEVLKAQPERLAACYSVVEVPKGSASEPAVLFWREKTPGTWSLEPDCPADVDLLK